MAGIKHLIECHCMLPQYRNKKDRQYHKFVVFSIIDNADCVIFQSNFNKELIETWFGPHKNGHVIHNGADLEVVREANGNYWNSQLGQDTEVWTCASSWRPHKRLKENIRYFMEHAPKDSILCVAGDGIKSDDFSGWSVEQFRRIRYLGKLDYISLLSLYKRSTTFIHLSYLDHCPNVVVDAQAAGCKIICSSTGGTSEIVNNGIIIQEETWNFKPIKLYNPPKMEWSAMERKIEYEEKPSIVNCSEKYYNIMKEVM